MISNDTVLSPLSDLRELTLTEMAVLSTGTVAETVRRILPGGPADAPRSQFNSAI